MRSVRSRRNPLLFIRGILARESQRAAGINKNGGQVVDIVGIITFVSVHVCTVHTFMYVYVHTTVIRSEYLLVFQII